MRLSLANIRDGRLMRQLCLTIVLSGHIWGCARWGYVPPEALEPPAGTFSRAISTFGQTVQKDHLTTYRREIRHDLFSANLSALLTTKDWDAKTVARLVKAQPPEDFLCLPRYSYQRVALRVGNIEALGTALGDRLQAPGTDIGKLLQSLATNYAIRTDVKDAPSNYDAWKRGEDGKRCTDTLKNGDPFVTRTYIGNEFGPAAIPAAIVVISAVWAMIKPVVVGSLQNVDLERRNAAIREYFANQMNVDALKQDLARTETYLEKEFQLAQQRAAGRALAATANLLDPTAPHWKKIKTIADGDDCPSALAMLVSQKTAPKGVACFDQALAAASGTLEQALNSADIFDGVMEQQVPKDAERLSAQVDTLRDIALGKQADDAKLKALWAAALRYGTLYQTVKDTASTANQKKVSDAVTEFLKAVK